MRFGNRTHVRRCTLFVRLLVALAFVLTLLTSNLALAFPQHRPGPEPSPGLNHALLDPWPVEDKASTSTAPRELAQPAVPAPGAVRPISPPIAGDPEVSRAPDASPASKAADARALPVDVAELPELVGQRTANSATFQDGEGHYATIVDAGALHYQDSQRAWQIIDPAFRPAEDSFVVESNSIRSRAGLSVARLSAAVDKTIIVWQATTLGALATEDSSRFVPLAKALDEPPGVAQRREDGRVLRYGGNWSDPSLAEEIISAPGSLEHLLILSEPPQANEEPHSGDKDVLELRARLSLLPGAELWADGELQSDPFETAGALEIRNAEGETALVFDPVLAFEQARPTVAVEGTYSARPGDEPGTWTIGLRTPWRWWMDRARRYPAVIDPTMHVVHSTGYETGMAWVANGHPSNPDSSDGSLHFGEMVLGSWSQSGQYSGYVQFNSIPHMLTNAPVSVTAATLDVEPTQVRMPYYSWTGKDWEMFPTEHSATLYDLGQCPQDCNGFSLTSEPAGFDWTSVPQGTAYGAKTLTGPPAKGGWETSVTSWDVTDRVRAWNQQHPRPDDGPAFRLTVNSNCSLAPSNPFFAMFIPECTRLVIPSRNVRLRIEYDELPIAVGDSFLNDPGVPSFYDGVFEEGTTNHQYDLAIPAGDLHWRAAAARGNHALSAALPTRTGLKLVDHTGGPVNLVDGTVQEADRTAVVLIDEHNPSNGIEVADLWAEVTASNENDFPTDEGRNYRIDHQQATEWALPPSAWQTQTVPFPTNRLIRLGEFDLDSGDNVLVRVSAPVTFPLTIGLAAPTTGSDKSDSALGNVNVDTSFGPEGHVVRDKSFGVLTGGTWALTLVNEGRPIPDPNPLSGPAIVHQVIVEMLRCPLGSIATARWTCQPVILPDVDTPQAVGLGLTVYSEGGFDGDPASDTWCTTNEGVGTPIIGPDAGGRWVAVGQGSVCRNGDVITTTEDSGIGLAIEIPQTFPDGTTRGRMPPTFIYGSVAQYPLPPGYPTGVVVRSGKSGELAPQEGTRRNIAPFDQYWGQVFTPGADAISTVDMTAHGQGIITATVTVDAGSEPREVDWSVLWSLYPESLPPYYYHFDAQAAQSPALHSPTSAITIASLALRILDDGGVATGLFESIDAYRLESTVNAGQLRAGRARITQDEDLGGASKNIQVVVQPPGAARLPANEKSCSYEGAPTSCLDLRRDDYAWDNGDGDKNVQPWELPDIHIEDSAGTMTISRPGNLQIFSADHSQAAEFDQSFSFDTWGATVSVKEEACTSGGPVVTVVRGSANIALPSIGDDGSGGTGILVDFKLCQAKLYQAKITLSMPPPGIPAGSTGVGINLIGGEVTVDPDFTRVELQLGFQTIDGGTITGGTGSVAIDTRGLFELQASALIVGIVDADLLLQVAWNPLDVLLEASASCCGGLISGGLRMHAWLGQGWQNKYDWLDDNDDFHFTGSIHATLKIPEGVIGDIGVCELPPFDITRSLTIAFGEFCTNASCSDYAWGMSVIFTIVGVDVGLYVDEAGPEFIIGTDSHVLIDQFGGSSGQSMVQPQSLAAPAPPPFEIVQPGNWQPYLTTPVKTPVDDWDILPAADYGCTGLGTSVHTCPISVTSGAGRALFTVGWENGALDVALIKPDTTVITPANGASHNVTVSDTSTSLLNQISFGVAEAAIASGVWHVQMSNVITDTQAQVQTNYQILYAAEPPPPTLTWTSPASTGTTPGAGGTTSLEWTALRAGQPLTPGIQIELFYTPADQKPVTPTVMMGTLIANQIAASDGSYTWDTNGLASGEYAVGGRIDDHVNANGHVVAWAPGTIVVTDTTPPPVPVIVSQKDVKDALIVIWQRDNDTPDLAGYLVEYTIPDWDVTAPRLDRVRRMLPHSPDQWPWFERIRLGGLLGGQPTDVCVRAYDASGNVSSCEPFTHVVARRPPPTLGPPRRISAYGGRDPLTGKTKLDIDWLAPDASTGTPTGYALSYNVAGCVLPGASSLADQGSSPIEAGNVLTFSLTGLTVGQTYRLAVNGITSQGYIGPEAATYALFIDPADHDVDGLPDQWADLYGLTGGAGDDPDGDGLTNGEELSLMSNPVHADSDNDGYYDGEEADWETDLCGPEHPPYHGGPQLALVGSSELTFKAASNQRSVESQELMVHNVGGGTLDWSATASHPWITLGSEGGSGPAVPSVGVDPSGLGAGIYSGTITFVNLSPLGAAGAGQTTAYRETASVGVGLTVLEPKDFVRYVFLPLILK